MTPLSDLARDVGVPFARDLAVHGARVAVITAERAVTYRELAAYVDQAAQELGTERRLVLLSGGNQLPTLVVYLAALSAGHPVLFAPGDRSESWDSLLATYDPDVVVTTGAAGIDTEPGGDSYPWWRIEQRRAVTVHDLHPELAALLTTSGSTGSPKLVRLSARNLQANAEAIATYLRIGPRDRAATTLPMHYCYGLSVINSHLLRGAGLILTERSVTEPEFWAAFREHRGTSFAGVPYTFDLLDRVGFETMRLPHLRYLTQAGGRLAPERVRRYAQLGQRDGWDLFVMYGQTEATARMAYLPPEQAVSHPDCIGVPIPGGSFRLEPDPGWPEPDTGELVFEGPNVMLGYAQGPADLGSGAEIEALRTGDIARRTDSGLYQIVGRKSRFSKVFGLRIDLQRVEAILEREGWTGCCAGGDDVLAVAVESVPPEGSAAPQDPDGAPVAESLQRLRELIARECSLPVRAVRVRELARLPRLPTGKPDYRAVRALVEREPPESSVSAVATAPERPRPGWPWRKPPGGGAGQSPDQSPGPPTVADLCQLYAEVLGRTGVTGQSTFVGLGADSLSYVELSVRLERALGRLPENWHTTPIQDLVESTPTRDRVDPTPDLADPTPETPSRRRVGTVETSVALRGIAIILVVGTHASLFAVAGGAHMLLGVAGYHFARFHLSGSRHRERLRTMARGIWRVAAVSMSWIALVVLLSDSYSLANVFLLHYVFGGEEVRHGWHFWFIESLVYIQLAMLLLVALPVVDRLERRFPFWLPMGLVGLGLITRYELVPGVELATPLVVFWLFALGWAAAKATQRWQRVLVTVAIVATIPGFFDSPRRVAVMIVGLLLLLWVTRLPSVGPLSRLLGSLAGASLFIYLTHWQVYPHLVGVSPLLAVLVSLVAGVAYAAVLARLTGRVWPPVSRRLRRAVATGCRAVRRRPALDRLAP